MVGVVIPAYNCAKTLPDTLNSLVAQVRKNFYVIVVDDGSTEDIESVVNKYNDLLHIKYIKLEKNSGVAKARQIGLEFCENANFEAIMFIDADDIVAPVYVDTLVRELKNRNADMIKSPIYWENKDRIYHVIDNDKNNTWFHGKIYSIKFLKENNISLDIDCRYSEDSGFNSSLLCASLNKYELPYPMYYWRYNYNSLTRNVTKEKNEYRNKYYQDYIKTTIRSLKTYANDAVYKNTSIFLLKNFYNSYTEIIGNAYIFDEEAMQLLKFYLTKIESLGVFQNKEKMNAFSELRNYVPENLNYNPPTIFQWISQILEKPIEEIGFKI